MPGRYYFQQFGSILAMCWIPRDRIVHLKLLNANFIGGGGG